MDDAFCFIRPGLFIPQSIWSLVFAPGTFESNTLDRYLDVKYTSNPGSYFSCGNTYQWNSTESFSADALSSDTVGAWVTRNEPKYSWESNSDEYYTLLMKDTGYDWLHALYVNIPGNDIARSQVLAPYFPPGNPSAKLKNVFVFMLFKQADKIQVDQRYTNIKIENRTPFNVTEFLRVHGLQGLVGMNILLVTGDAFSRERAKQLRINNCARLIGDATKGDPITRPFIPLNYNFSVFVNVTYSSDAIDFRACCSDNHYDALTVSLNPVGHSSVKPIFAREVPKIELNPTTLFFDPQTGFKDKRYTLAMLDPDDPSPTDGRNDRPFLHWLAVNIPNGNVSQGDQVVGYMGPSPPAPPTHYYYFLLFEQKGTELDKSAYLNYTKNCERCLFDVTGFAGNNSMELVGASWMRVGVDEYVRYSRVELRNQSIKALCTGVSGYTKDCSSGNPLTAVFTLTLVAAILATIV